MSETELLPCPFCGPGESIVEPWHDDVSHRWRVGCGRCGCSTGIHPRDKTLAPAVAAWNRRAKPSSADWKALFETAQGALICIGQMQGDAEYARAMADALTIASLTPAPTQGDR